MGHWFPVKAAWERGSGGDVYKVEMGMLPSLGETRQCRVVVVGEA